MVFFDNLGYGVSPPWPMRQSLSRPFWRRTAGTGPLHLLGASVMTLILINIRNARDLMLTVVRRQSNAHNP
jgi:hypothetical protein